MKENWRYRISHSVTQYEVRNILEAADFAYCWLRAPLNLFITIHWEGAGLRGRIQEASSLLRHRVGDWLRDRGVPLISIFILENPPGGGLHEHLLLHVPQEWRREFSHRLRGWLRQSGATIRKGVLKTKPIGDPDRNEQEWGFYLKNLYRLLGYLLKGCDPKTHNFLEIEKRPAPQGQIIGKRSGVSEAIGPSARRAAAVPIAPDMRRLKWNPARVILRFPDILDDRFID